MILIVDGNNISMRAAYGCAQLYDKFGTPTGCFMTTVRTICNVADKVRPDRVFCVWDAGHSKFRKALLPTYKDRGEIEDDEAKIQLMAEWRVQVGLLKKHLPLLGVGQFEVGGCEADDIIFKIVRTLSETGMESVILSSDQDFCQLLSPLVSIWNLKKDECLRAGDLEGIYGVTPSQWVEYRCMTGDDSDKIPGVQGIGEKRASAIMKEFGDLRRFFATPEAEKEKAYIKTLRSNGEIIERNRKLMDLKLLPENEVPSPAVDVLMDRALSLEPDKQAFWKICIKHDLNTLLGESNLWPTLWGGS